jgi:hypothetical protein
MQKSKKSKWQPPIYVTRYYSAEALVEENGYLGNHGIEKIVGERIANEVNLIISCQVENSLGSKNLNVGDLVIDTSQLRSERGEGCVILSRCSLGNEMIYSESDTLPEICLKDGKIDVTLSDVKKKFYLGQKREDGTIWMTPKEINFQHPSDRFFSLRLTGEMRVIFKAPVKFWLV